MPNNWKKYKLGDLCESISYGYTESAVWENIGPKFLRITDIQNDFITWDLVPHCKINDKDKLKYKLEIGDILIARTGNSTGATAIIKDDIEAVYASYLIKYNLNKSLAHPFFIGHILKSSVWKSFVKSIIGGSAQPGANAKQFAEFEINLPPLPEQQAIAEILSSLDDKIELNLQTNKTLEEMANALYKHWFVDFGPFLPPGRCPQDGRGPIPGFVESELGLIPEGWEVKTIGELYKTTSGGTPSRSKMEYYINGHIQWVKSKELNGTFIVDTEEKITSDALRNSSAKIIPAKSVLLAMYGATVGEVGIITNSATCNQAICALISNELSYTYIFHYLKNNKQNILNNAVGSAQQNISQEIIKELPILNPPIKLVKNILEQTETLFNQIELNIIENQTLKQTRDYLLPKLISGEIRVKDIDINEALGAKNTSRPADTLLKEGI